MQHLLPNQLGRLYHAELYDRMVAFGREYTPEFPIEPIAEEWLRRFYAHDPLLHLLVEIDEQGSLWAHAVIDVQQVYGAAVVWCHQAHSDVMRKGKAHRDGFAEGFEYIDKLAASCNAVCSVFYVTKHTKVYEERYGYQTARVMLVKRYGVACDTSGDEGADAHDRRGEGGV